MAKTNSLKIAKILLALAYIVAFLGLLGFSAWGQITNSGYSVSSLIYWWILLGWLGLLYNLKWRSSASLTPAFTLFVIAAVLTTVGLREAGETVMRVSFIGWLVGTVQALIEYNIKK